MKTLLLLVMTFALAAGSVAAGTAKSKLISSMVKEQKQAESVILRMWVNNQRGKELDSLLADYVVREVRLQAMKGDLDTRTLLASVKQKENVNVESPSQLAKAIVLEHFRRKGLSLETCVFVKGKYLIRSGCMKRAEPSFASVSEKAE